jgi:type III restriction enzyme
VAKAIADGVKAKRDAGRRWANHNNTDETVSVSWRLLVSEADVETAKGSWSALKRLGGESGGGASQFAPMA